MIDVIDPVPVFLGVLGIWVIAAGISIAICALKDEP